MKEEVSIESEHNSIDSFDNFSRGKITELLEEYLPESSYIEETENGRVVDVDRMRKLFVSMCNQHRNKHRVAKYDNRRIVTQSLMAQALFDRHRDENVYTLAQVASGDISPKPLFYRPESAESATSSIEIADSEFHLPLWDLGKNVAKGKKTLYPTMDGSEISGMEARIALLLFHPDYGDARRDPRDGKLYIKNPDYSPTEPTEEKRVVFGVKTLQRFGGDPFMNYVYRDNELQNKSIRAELENALPHLIASGELKPEDIQQITLTWKGNVVEKMTDREIKQKYVMFGGVRHYVGEKFNGCNAKPLNENTALVFKESKGHNIVQGSFTLIPKAEASAVVKDKDGKVLFRSANASMTNVRSIDYQKLIPDTSTGFREHTVEKKREALAQEVTHTVESLIELAENAEKLVDSEYGEDTLSPKEIRDELLIQVERLVIFASKAESETQLREGLKVFEGDVRVFSALSKHAGLQELFAKPLEQVSATELSDEDKVSLRTLLHSNYLIEYPDHKDAKFRKGVEKSFEDALKNPNTTFYILRDEGQIVSFYRYDDLTDVSGKQVAYFGSFNGNPLYKGASGHLPEKTTQEKLTQVDRMFAHCDPKSEVSKKYIESGYIGVQQQEVWGKPSFEIWRSADSNTQLQTKQMSVTELVALSEQTQPKDSDYFVREVTEDDAFEELDDGLPYLLTRYFTHHRKTYAAFELNTDLSKQFTYTPPEDQKKVA